MGEHLLCKQGVVGSIPSASRVVLGGRVLLGCVLLSREDARSGFGCWITAVGRGLVFGACDVFVGCLVTDGWVEMGSLWIVNQVLVRFGRAGRLGGFLLGRVAVWRGSAGEVRDGLAWVV